MEEYTKVTIHKKETNCIVFNIEPSYIKESTSIEYRSPSFTFKDHPKDECYLSFISVLVKDKVPIQKVAGMTLHFINKQASQAETCTYQVVASVLNRPEFGVHAFQSHRFGIGELKHWKFFSINELSKVTCKNSIVQICFDITRYDDQDIMSIESTFIPQKDDKMMKLYCFAKSEEYTDVILKVEEEEIKAHKNILASCSPVFDAMFKSRMKEEQTGTIKIENFKPHVIKEMLYYIYNNDVEDLPKMAYNLFEAAHFYDLVDLESMCKDYLMSNISVNNLTALLDLAEKYNLKDMQASLSKYIKYNEAQVVKSIEYLDYLLSRLSVTNIAKCLVLADRYKLKDFKIPLKEFVRDNIKEVIKDSKYRYLYNTNMTLILEIDEFMANHYKN